MFAHAYFELECFKILGKCKTIHVVSFSISFIGFKKCLKPQLLNQNFHLKILTKPSEYHISNNNNMTYKKKRKIPWGMVCFLTTCLIPPHIANASTIAMRENQR